MNTVSRRMAARSSCPSQEWFTWGDCYALDIADSADEMLALAVVLAIDAVHAQANAAAAST